MSKKRKIFVSVFIFFIVLCIVGFYIYHNDKQHSYVVVDEERGMDLNSFYDKNSILFETKEISINGISYSYLQIDGLKRSKIENNINKDITKQVQKFIETNTTLKSLQMEVKGNFGNILSLAILADMGDDSVSKFINYNLVNGEVIKLSDLFTTSAPVDKIVKANMYQILSKGNNCSVDDNGNIVDNNGKCNDLKKQAEKYITLYENHDFEFMFGNVSITLKIDDLCFEIFYIDYPEYFNLHHKFLTNVSIYKNDKIGQKDILIASYRDNGIYSVFDYQGDNVYVDLTVLSGADISEEITKGIKSITDEEILAFQNQEDFIFLNQSGKLSKEYDYYLAVGGSEEVLNNQYNIYHLLLESDIYSMDLEYFESHVKEEIYRLHRTVLKEETNLIDLDKDKNISRSKASNEYIVLANGEVLASVEDLFVDGYDYEQIIKDRLITSYSIKEELLDEKLEYSYILYHEDINKAYTIVVENEKFGECYIPFATFDSKMMNIY